MGHQQAAIGDTVYFYFASNDTSGSGGDGATPLFDVREAGEAAGAAPLLSGTPTLLTHANYPAGCHEVAVPATVGNGFASNDTFAVFCSLAIDSQNPTGFIGSCTLTPLATLAGQTTAQNDLDIITGTNGVLIDDDAITASKYDESTAFPVVSADTGATQIARTGADADTLETLSDQADLQATLVINSEGRLSELDSANLPAVTDAILLDTGTTLPTEHAALSVQHSTLATEAKQDIIDSNVDAILVDTSTTLPTQIGNLNDISANDVNVEVLKGLNTAIPVPGSTNPASMNDYVRRVKFATVNKFEVDEDDGDARTYDDSDTLFNTVAAAFTSASTITKREKLL